MVREAALSTPHDGFGRVVPHPPGDDVFCFFFSKKKCLLSYLRCSAKKARLRSSASSQSFGL
jgi:hypothetical protein